MKRYLFIYREDREAYVDPDFGWENRIVFRDSELPRGTTDREVLEKAHGYEVFDFVENNNTCDDGKLNRRLLRVIQIARDLSI